MEKMIVITRGVVSAGLLEGGVKEKNSDNVRRTICMICFYMVFKLGV